MAHEEEVVSCWLATASPELRRLVKADPHESIQRPNDIRSLVDECLRVLDETR